MHPKMEKGTLPIGAVSVVGEISPVGQEELQTNNAHGMLYVFKTLAGRTVIWETAKV